MPKKISKKRIDEIRSYVQVLRDLDNGFDPDDVPSGFYSNTRFAILELLDFYYSTDTEGD